LEPVVVDASDYGAATKRKRVIVFGYKPEYFGQLTHKDIFTPFDKNNKVTVKDVIEDLPEPIPQNKNKNDFGWAKYNNKRKLSSYALKMRALPPAHLGSEEAVKKLKLNMLSGFFDTVHTKEVIARYQVLKPESTDKISRSKKLSWSGVCPTLRAGTGSDKGSYQAVRPIHPSSPRVITVREAARLQGFPDWFCFHATKWHSFRMIGNSVSPLVSENIMTNIKNRLDYIRQEQEALLSN
jgi:DNA (cytosine-5)-methyltransferase 1